MFTFDELKQFADSDSFKQAIRLARQFLAQSRLGHSGDFSTHVQADLAYYAQAVLASVPNWTLDEWSAEKQYEARILCREAAEIEESLAELAFFSHQPQRCLTHWRSAYLLYEFADLPAMAQMCARAAGWTPPIGHFAQRLGIFHVLQSEEVIRDFLSDISPSADRPFESALGHLAIETGLGLQFGESAPDPTIAWVVIRAASFFSGDMSQTEVAALCSLFSKRFQSASLRSVHPETRPQLRKMGFPVELWAPQCEAIEKGMLDEEIESWGLSAPTGTGKTYLTRLLILDHLKRSENGRVLYIVPSRALINEVSQSLSLALEPTDIYVHALGAHLTSLRREEEINIKNAQVIVATPERADMLLRIGVQIIKAVSLVIVDEAHHIEDGTRGALLELYLWRLRHLLHSQARIVQLSAVAPNIEELTRWLGSRTRSVLFDWRSTRMRAGVLNRERGQGIIRYHDGTSVVLLDKVPEDDKELLLDAVQALGEAGPVLVLCGKVSVTEKLAEKMAKRLAIEGMPGVRLSREQKKVLEQLNSYLEREMYSGVPLKEYMRHRVAYHHAGLPHRVRHAIEWAIRDGMVDFVFATTTLAEGVNFPFSTVLVQTLAIGYDAITPRRLWNIAGRAGRPGEDIEGQCILFGPELHLDRTQYVLDDYVDPSLKGVPPVTSALFDALEELQTAVEQEQIRPQELQALRFDHNGSIPPKAQGALNLLRISAAHARVNLNGRTDEEVWKSLFRDSLAGTTMDDDGRQASRSILGRQIKAIDEFIHKAEGVVDDALLAELGITLDALGDLVSFVRDWADWQAERFSKIIIRGEVNFDQTGYLLGPVCKAMSDLEGKKLGGYYAFVAVEWLRGIPISAIKKRSNYKFRLEKLVRDIYTQIQFLLPWALYATHRLAEREVVRRGIPYYGGIDTLAWLADAGVPSVDALRLTQAGFERVDATRVAQAYRQSGARQDILVWVKQQLFERLEEIIEGEDNRRLDFRLHDIISRLP